MGNPNEKITELKDIATPIELAYIESYERLGTWTAVAKEVGRGRSTVLTGMEALRKRAARLGRAPGHFNDGVAPGYAMGKVTIQRGPNGVERVWERQHPEAADIMAGLKAAAEAMAEELPRAQPVKAPLFVQGDLCAFVTFSDVHIGMLAHREISGDEWNIDIAEQTLTRGFLHLIAAAPACGKLVINVQGDTMHTDGIKPVTPGHGHLLDSDGAYSRAVKASIRILRQMSNAALARFSEVVLVIVPGNHDPSGMVWMRHLFSALYEDEPRLTVTDCETPYFAIQHGQVMLAIHHGHMRKPHELPLTFAASYPAMWGSTTKRYAHCGHRHHVEEKEFTGMKVIQHPTIAGKDKYATDGGWLSEREATLIVYHAQFGQVARNTVTPEMLA